MIVDDEPDITKSMKLGLERRGIDVIPFNNPLLALEEIKKKSRRYELIITDIRMPEMNGLELYREIRKVDRDTPVCFMTAFEIYISEFQKLFPNIQPAGFLRKPVTLAELALTIDRVTDGQQRARLEA
jgi:DNA-binding NtrC family response regulator